jgi:hypothetical protein
VGCRMICSSLIPCSCSCSCHAMPRHAITPPLLSPPLPPPEVNRIHCGITCSSPNLPKSTCTSGRTLHYMPPNLCHDKKSPQLDTEFNETQEPLNSSYSFFLI